METRPVFCQSAGELIIAMVRRYEWALFWRYEDKLMKKLTVDPEKVEAFSERMVNVLNDASLALMTSIGHRTDLFDTMAKLPPATSGQIAEASGLNERYVREWLGAMVTSQVITYEPDNATYWLPRTCPLP